MCGRYSLGASRDLFEAAFGVAPPEAARPSFNVAPGRPVVILRRDGRKAPVEAAAARWGLIPPWANRPDDGGVRINARSETAAVRSLFRDAFRHRRCLVPADGYYAWRRTDGAGRPYFLRRKDGRLFAFAGLWRRTRLADGTPFDSCAILTTEADAVARPVHHRMPVILPEERRAAWLDPSLTDPEEVGALLAPLAAAATCAYAVSPRVNGPGNDGAGCRAPADADAAQGTLF